MAIHFSDWRGMGDTIQRGLQAQPPVHPWMCAGFPLGPWGCAWHHCVPPNPRPHSMQTEFCKDITTIKSEKATAAEEKCSGSFYPRSLITRGQTGLVKRAWALEICSPGFESLPRYLIT